MSCQNANSLPKLVRLQPLLSARTVRSQPFPCAIPPSTMFLDALLFALTIAAASFMAPKRRRRDRRPEPPLPHADVDSFEATVVTNVPMRGVELFLSSSSEGARAIWTIEVWCAIPELTREIRVGNGSTDPELHRPPVGHAQPIACVEWSFRALDGAARGALVCATEEPIYLVNHLATPHLEYHLMGPSQFGDPSQMLGQQFTLVTPCSAGAEVLRTRCLVVSDGVFRSLTRFCLHRGRRGFD